MSIPCSVRSNPSKRASQQTQRRWKSETRIGGAYEPRHGEERGLVAGEEVAGIEDDLRELEQEEGDVGRAGELGRHGVPLLILLRVLRGNPTQAIRGKAIDQSINQSRDIPPPMPGEKRESEGTLRTGLEVVVAAAGGGPCRRRWWRRSAGWWYDAGALDARGFRRAARGAAALGEPPARYRRERGGDAGRSGRRRLGTDGDDMAGG